MTLLNFTTPAIKTLDDNIGKYDDFPFKVEDDPDLHTELKDIIILFAEEFSKKHDITRIGQS